MSVPRTTQLIQLRQLEQQYWLHQSKPTQQATQLRAKTWKRASEMLSHQFQRSQKLMLAQKIRQWASVRPHHLWSRKKSTPKFKNLESRRPSTRPGISFNQLQARPSPSAKSQNTPKKHYFKVLKKIWSSTLNNRARPIGPLTSWWRTFKKWTKI